MKGKRKGKKAGGRDGGKKEEGKKGRRPIHKYIQYRIFEQCASVNRNSGHLD